MSLGAFAPGRRRRAAAAVGVLAWLAAGLLTPAPATAQGATPAPAPAPAPPAQPAPPTQTLAELVRVKPDVYAFRFQNHVSMFVPTDEGVILIDPIGQANGEAPAVLKAAVRSVTEQPVTWMVYSHWGADHGIGGAVFKDTATFVSQANAAPKIVAANDPTSPPPSVVVDGGMVLEAGGKSVVLQHTALSPTDDYLAVWYPEQKVLMMVDQVRARTIAFGNLPYASPQRMAEHLQYLADTFDFDVFLWGHNAGAAVVGTRQDFLDHRQYLLDLEAAVLAARAAGHADNSEAMVAAVRTALAPKYGTWQSFPAGLAQNVSGVIRWAS
jgi:glyoxylase-like metal-dependent hydrolase (beta-lactamase superfamily II)